MLKVSSTIIFSFIWCVGLWSQDIHQLKEHADQQFARGNLTAALKEYQRVLFFDDQQQYRDVYSDIADIYYATEDLNQAMVYYDFARKAIPDDSLKLEYSFRRILCYFKQENYLLGLTDLYDLPDPLSPYFEAKRNLYFAICHFGLDETDQSLQYFSEVVDSSGLAQINNLFNQFERYKKKYDPNRLELMSIFLPGLGQFVGGDVKNGLNSILLLGGIATYSYYTMLSYGILDGTLVLVTWFYRYYTGGHKKAAELGALRIQEKQDDTYQQMLDIVNHHEIR